MSNLLQENFTPVEEEDVIKTDRLKRYEGTFIRKRRTGIK